MYKLGILILALFAVCFSQLNEKQYSKDITTFKADSTWFGDWISATDGENLKFTAMFNDTTATGYASDSIAAKLGYQYGASYISYSGFPTVVAEGPVIFIDSVRSVAGRFTTTTWLAADADSFPTTMLDSSGAIGYAFHVKRFQNLWVNSYIRPVITGLTGNNKDAFLRARHVTTQRKWSLAGKN